MKCVGARWLVRLYEHFLESPEIISNGFLASGIPQSIDNNNPYLDKEVDTSTSEEVDRSASDSSEEYSSGDSEDDTSVADSDED